MRSRGTFDTLAIAIANFELANDTRSTSHNARIRRNSRRANVLRTRIHVIRNIGIIVDCRVLAILANLELAITRDLIHARRGEPVERRERADPNACIT